MSCCCCCFWPLDEGKSKKKNSIQKIITENQSIENSTETEMSSYKDNPIKSFETQNSKQLEDENKKLKEENNYLKKENKQLKERKEKQLVENEEYNLLSKSNDTIKSIDSIISHYSEDSQKQVKKMRDKMEELKKSNEEKDNIILDLKSKIIQSENPDESKKKIKFIFYCENEKKEYPLNLVYEDQDKFSFVVSKFLEKNNEFICKGIKSWKFNEKNIDYSSLIKDNQFNDVSKIIFNY